MNAKQRNEYWIKVERLRSKLDRKYSSLFREAISKDLQKVASDVREVGPQAARSMMGAYAWNDSMMTIMNELYRESAILFGNASYRAVRLMSRKAADPFGLNNDLISEIINFLMFYGFTLVAEMTQTTKKNIDQIIQQAIADDKSSEEIAQLIMSDKSNGYSRMRAMRIARTEVMRSSNYAAMKGAEKLGFEVDKVWIASRDNRTRRIPRNSYDHFNMDGMQVPYAEPFLSRGKQGDTVVAAYPGDPTTPAGFTINCRCTIAFMPKRNEFGQLIEKR